MRKAKVKPTQPTRTAEEEAAAEVHAAELKAELDDLLEEVDAVLEENAEEFLKGYRQKGGQ